MNFKEFIELTEKTSLDEEYLEEKLHRIIDEVGIYEYLEYMKNSGMNDMIIEDESMDCFGTEGMRL